MAGQVPYNPSPTVEPQGIPNDYQNINASPNAFGAQIGQQLEKTGNEFDQLAVQKATYANELYANDHSTQGMKALNGAWDAYGQYQGRAAHDMLPQFQESVEKIYQENIAAAPNDQAREMASRSMRVMSDQYLRMGQNHASNQFNVWRDQTTKDHAIELGNQAGLAVNQIGQDGKRSFMENLVEAGANDMRTYATDHSLDEMSTNKIVSDYKGAVYQTIIKERIASGDLNSAKEIYQDHADEMSAAHRLATEQALKPILKKQTSDAITDWLWNGGQGAAPKQIDDIAQQNKIATKSMTITPPNRDAMIRTVIGEAGDESPQSQAGVAWVIRNRVASGFAPNVTDVVYQKGQFEPWGNPNTAYKLTTISPNSPEYQRAAAVVDDVISGKTSDPTKGATHFYAPVAQSQLGRNAPSWAAQFEYKGTIGGHQYYRDPDRNVEGGLDTSAVSPAKDQSQIDGTEHATLVKSETYGPDGKRIDVDQPRGELGGGPPEQTATLARAAELTKSDPDLQRQVLNNLRQKYSVYKTENAVEINQLQTGIPDMIAQAKAGAYDGNIPEDRIRALFPQKQAQKWIDEFQVAKRGGEMLRSAQWASPDDIQAMEQDLFSGTGVHSMQLRIARGKGTTGPGTTGAEPESAEDKASDFKERVQLAQQFEQFRKKRDDVLTGPNADPAVYVAPSPQVAPAYAKFREVEQAAQGKPPGSPEQNAAALAYQDYASKSLAMQAALGVPEGKRHLLAKDQATSLVAEITKPNSDPKSMMQGLEQTYGQSWPAISKDLAKLGGLPAPYQAIRTLDDQNASQLSEFLKSTTQSTEEKGNDPSKFKSPEKMIRDLSADDKLITNIRNSVRSSTSMVKMDNSYRQMGRSEDFIDSVHQAVDYLAYAKQFGIGGAKSTNAANDAVSAFIDKFDFMDDPGQAMVPKDKIATVKESARNVVDALEEADVQTPASIANSGKAVPFSDIGERGRVGGLSPSHYFEAVKAAPTWKNLPDGSGLVLTDAAVTGQMGRYVRDRDGNAIVVKFDAPLVPRSSKNIEEDNLPETRKAG